tara:strand:+ start:33 stop:149 length:117 start_codon:yes stop_codon:yes gene_type:complete
LPEAVGVVHLVLVEAVQEDIEAPFLEKQLAVEELLKQL